MKNELATLDTEGVQSRLVELRGQRVLLDRDVAALYGVQTREINQAIRNNPDKFPDGYVFELSKSEFADWRSKILISDIPDEEKAGIRKGLRVAPNAFTERGLYMLATILKGDRAVKTTLAIIETYAQLRAMVRDMESLQTLKDGSAEQAQKLSAAGHKLAALIGDNLSTESTKTTIELNLAVLKITHEVSRSKQRN